MVWKHFSLVRNAFQGELVFSPLWPTLTHPTTHLWDYWGGDTKRGGGGSYKGEKQVNFKIHLRWFKAFLDHVFSIKGAGWVGPDP